MTELTSPAPFDPASILGDLAKRSDDLEKGLELDLRLPRWSEPEVWVVYKPASFEKLEATQQRAEKAKPKDRAEVLINGHMDTLIDACIGIYAVIDGEKYSLGKDPKGDFTRFDQELAGKLGLEDTRARAVVRKMFLNNDGDIISTLNELSEWSGYREQELKDRISGE